MSPLVLTFLWPCHGHLKGFFSRGGIFTGHDIVMKTEPACMAKMRALQLEPNIFDSCVDCL